MNTQTAVQLALTLQTPLFPLTTFTERSTLADLQALREEAEVLTHIRNAQVWADYQARQYQLPLIQQGEVKQ